MSQPPQDLNDLPSEVLGAIFRLYFSSFSRTDYQALYEARTTLSSVSCRWNGIVTSDPQNWSTMHIDLDRRYPRLKTVGRWLKRAAHVPVDLTVAGQQKPQSRSISRETYAYVTECFSVIFPRIPHWGSLKLYMGAGFCQSLPFLPLYAARNLGEIQISVGGQDDSGFGPLMDAVYSTPSLRRLTVKCCHMLDAIHPILDPTSTTFSRLTHLSISVPEISASLLLQVLRSSTSAVQINITADGVAEGGSALSGQAVVTLPQLQWLALDFCGVGYNIFTHFNFPRLKALHHSDLFSPLPEAEKSLSPLQNFIEDSGHLLRILRIRNKEMKSQQLFNLFSTPQLRRIPIVEVQARSADEDNELPDFGTIIDDDVFSLTIQHKDSNTISMGWIVPEVYDSTDDNAFMYWGIEFYGLLHCSRSVSGMFAELRKRGHSPSRFEAADIYRAIHALEEKELQTHLRRVKETCARRSVDSATDM